MIFLTAEDIADFNSEIVPNGARESSQVEALSSRVLNAHYYENVTDVYELAAMYMIAISRGHVFLDGNKRTAFQSGMLFLHLNGVDICDMPALVEMMVDVARGETGREELAQMLRELTER
ncbi:type II toxin-antitoxin system death-on-curing family toxin [Erwinia mallotivora]|uniref:type II toxin-antitoxin system death-on-curing family toxin n=1 Tax=Erwinia mallotivora TaxID=69222 RepID=UPI0035EA448A